MQFYVFLERFIISLLPVNDPFGSKHVGIIIKIITKNLVINAFYLLTKLP